MADYDGNIIDAEIISGEGDSAPGFIVPNVEFIQGFAHPVEIPDPFIIQRIWDTSVGWCQFTEKVFNSTPASGDTEPNHTNNLAATTHQKLGEIEDV